tara:strand:+ start:141 stop:350 length:210 start_codon:yes stop_codon:yes gene_type:complete
MLIGYEGYIAVAICLFCTWLGYIQGRRTGIEVAVNGMINLKILEVLDNGELVAGSKLNENTTNRKFEKN